jgi:anti-sigma regulatory factor (Ser/Thr protein kinase)
MPEDDWRSLGCFEISSEPGNERAAIAQVTDLTAPLALSDMRQEQLKTAVGEAVLNAIEHGNEARPELSVAVEVGISAGLLTIRIKDQGEGGAIIRRETPDLASKLAGLQRPRGWGLFLIEHMVDELRVTNDATGHTVELVLYIGDEQVSAGGSGSTGTRLKPGAGR